MTIARKLYVQYGAVFIIVFAVRKTIKHVYVQSTRLNVVIEHFKTDNQTERDCSPNASDSLFQIVGQIQGFFYILFSIFTYTFINSFQISSFTVTVFSNGW